ncbi:MAG: hypothetical protein N2050_04500 [Flavobacteriales bacterium]|nr:hypothetical protein [Flavobacteriales bacterium]
MSVEVKLRTTARLLSADGDGPMGLAMARGFDTAPGAPTQPPHSRSLSSRAKRGVSKGRI